MYIYIYSEHDNDHMTMAQWEMIHRIFPLPTRASSSAALVGTGQGLPIVAPETWLESGCIIGSGSPNADSTIVTIVSCINRWWHIDFGTLICFWLSKIDVAPSMSKHIQTTMCMIVCSKHHYSCVTTKSNYSKYFYMVIFKLQENSII